MPSAHFDEILKSAHDRGFVVAGALKADLLTDFHDAVTQAAKDGKSIQWFRQNFNEIVRKHGWEGWTGSDTKAGRDWRARIIYQTNLTTSYAAGRWAQLNDPDLIKLRPYWKYIHNDNVQHPRPLHVSWSGMVLKHDDPWWKTHFPPNGWGCRCRVTAVSARQFDGDTPPDDGARTVEDRFGQSHRVPNGIDYGWDYAPGASRLRQFQDIIDDKLIRFPTPIGAAMWQTLKPVLAMERQLKWWQTLDEWLATPQAGRVAVVGAIDPTDLYWIRDNQAINPETAAITIREGLIRGAKQGRHSAAGDALTFSEWRQLTRVIDDPEQVLYDHRTGKILYVHASEDSREIKIAVEFNAGKKGQKTSNQVVSGFKQTQAIIDQMIRGKLYEIIR